MMLRINKTDVWAATMTDEPGSLALALQKLADADTHLECVIARRHPELPGNCTAFVTPINGAALQSRAPDSGFHPALHMPTLRIEGTNRPGTGASIAKAVGDAHVNMHGLSAMAMGRRFVCYIGFDSESDRERAVVALRALRTRRWSNWTRALRTRRTRPLKTKAG